MVGEFNSGGPKWSRRALADLQFAEGPRLYVPNVGMTRGHKSIYSALSNGLKRPLSEIRIAWNTGVRATDPRAGILLHVGKYLNKVLFTELREKSGDSYTPEASFKADSCSVSSRSKIQSSSNPELVEQRSPGALSRP